MIGRRNVGQDSNSFLSRTLQIPFTLELFRVFGCTNEFDFPSRTQHNLFYVQAASYAAKWKPKIQEAFVFYFCRNETRGRFVVEVMRALFAAILFLPAIAFPDDGYLAYGGTPKLLKGHTSIRMVSERVVISISRQSTTYDCTFHFRNEGAACDVLIGFPDSGFVGPKRDSDDDAGPDLTGFRSWVNGREVKTALLWDKPKKESWHTKSVHFRTGQSLTVRDTFRIQFGAGAIDDPKGGYIHERRYVMHTGASWKGPVGNAEVIIRLRPRVLPSPFRLMSLRQLGMMNPYQSRRWRGLPKNTLVWGSFARPKVVGRTLVFSRRNFEPTDRDDVGLWFGFDHKVPKW